MSSDAPTFITEDTNFSSAHPQTLKFAWEAISHHDSARPDNREPNVIREISIEKNILTRADGSVSYKAGNTYVTASVNGPLVVDTNKEKIDSCTLDVSVKFRHSTGSGMVRLVCYYTLPLHLRITQILSSNDYFLF